jgi:hypothetical protein
MHYWLPPRFPTILWYCEFGKSQKLATLVKFIHCLWEITEAHEKNNILLKFPYFFVKKWQNLLGKKTLIATSLVVNLPVEHTKCVKTLSHKTLANITIPTSMVASKSRQPERNMGKLNTHHAQNATCGGSWTRFRYEINKFFITCAKR